MSSVPNRGPPLWRQLLAVAVLPVVATIVVPALLVSGDGVDVGWGLPAPASALPPLIGAASVIAGLRLMFETISMFGTTGEGTLAPWDPTRVLVVRGPYRRVRNPMITGVGLVLLGAAAVLSSLPVLIWFGLFALANAIFIPLVEEPGLVRRFGDDYIEYRRAVPRWIPRRKPWTPGD